MSSKWTALPVAVVVLSALGYGILQSRRAADVSSRLAEAENRALELEKQLASLEARLVPGPEAEVDRRPQPTEQPQVPVSPAPVDREAIRALRESLDHANASVSQLQSKALELEAKTQELLAENKRLASSERELSQDLSISNRLVNALRTELKGKDERITHLELANAKFRDQTSSDAQRLRDLTQISQELQEIHRRRDVYLTSLMRRYRELTEQYRALSGVVESRAETEVRPVTGAELARIQTALNMAEDDLRQVNTLTAQALRVQNKLAGK